MLGASDFEPWHSESRKSETPNIEVEGLEPVVVSQFSVNYYYLVVGITIPPQIIELEESILLSPQINAFLLAFACSNESDTSTPVPARPPDRVSRRRQRTPSGVGHVYHKC